MHFDLTNYIAAAFALFLIALYSLAAFLDSRVGPSSPSVSSRPQEKHPHQDSPPDAVEFKRRNLLRRQLL